jgi:hypothetical protein
MTTLQVVLRVVMTGKCEIIETTEGTEMIEGQEMKASGDGGAVGRILDIVTVIGLWKGGITGTTATTATAASGGSRGVVVLRLGSRGRDLASEIEVATSTGDERVVFM